MNNNLRFELSFKNIPQLEDKLNFCKLNKINNINIPCKGLLKKEFFNLTFEFIKKNYEEFNVVYHYSLYHQYSKNRDISYCLLRDFVNKCNSNNNQEILLISGTNKKKNFNVIDVLRDFKNENLDINLGIAYNPYLNKYFNVSSERERYCKKISSGLIKSIWFQFGTDIKILEREFNYLKNNETYNKVNFFGSLFIPSRQFIARFKYRPWKGVYISEKYLNSHQDFYKFSKDLFDFYISNEIVPLIETDCSSTEKLDIIKSFLKN